MNTQFFGRSAWVVLHVGMDLAIRHKWSGSRVQTNLLQCVHDVLCCVHCRNGFRQFMAILPFPAHLPSFHWAPWLIQLHNLVNNKLQRPPYQHAQHPFGPQLLIVSMIDLLYSAALNIPEVVNDAHGHDRAAALTCFMHLVATLHSLQRSVPVQPVPSVPPISREEAFVTTYQWIHHHLSKQVLTLDQTREAFEFRRAKS